MFFKKKCCRKPNSFPTGHILIAAGAGLMLAHIIPYYITIIIIGVGLVAAGICFLKRK